MKKEYKEDLEDVQETCIIDAGNGKKIEIDFSHFPNVAGKRSKFTGLPIWVGKTKARALGVEAVALCWVKEPYSYERGRYVTAGRILKKLGLPTSLAEQVRK